MPYAQQVLNMLPTLWADAGEQHLFKVSILVVVTKLTEVSCYYLRIVACSAC